MAVPSPYHTAHDAGTTALLTLLLVLTAIVVPPSHAQVQLLTVQNGRYPELSASCVAVLNQEVACDALLATAGGRTLSGIHYYYDRDDLGKLCTDTCERALSTWTRRISGACQGKSVTYSDGAQELVDAWAEQFVETYDSVCLKGANGEFCNAVLADAAGVDPLNQKPTASPDTNINCHTCMFSLLQTQLAMPLASLEVIGQLFTSLTKVCSATGFTVPRAPSMTFSTPAPTPTNDDDDDDDTSKCDGETYQLSLSDNCQGVSTSQGISAVRLIMANDLQAFCHEFPTSGTLCIPEDWTCTPYTVKKDDTCASIASAHEKSWAQITAWNPELGRNCDKISRHIGYVICVSAPGGEWVNPSPMASQTADPGEDDDDEPGFPFMDPAAMTPIAQIPMGGSTLGSETDINDDLDTATPWASGTRLDCVLYASGPVTLDATAGNTSSACADVAAQYGISVEDLVSWNRSLGAAGDGACALREDANYCVRLFEDVPADTTEQCVFQYMTRPGDTCATFRSRFSLSIEQFDAWNPSVGAGCESFALGKTYCVEVLHYKQSGIISTCDKFALVDDDTDPCTIIEEKYGLSHARFMAWNPAVGQDCTGLYRGYDYCVSIPNFQPVYSTTRTSSASPTTIEKY